MKARNFKNAIALSVITAILVGCSGGATETAPIPTIPRASSGPSTTNPSPVSPMIGSGPITVGMSGNETIDDVNTKLDGIINKQNAQDAKLDAAANKLNEINKNASDASSNSNWAKWLGVAAVSMLAVPMIYNGIQNYQATGDVGKALGATVTNSDTEVNDLNMKKRSDAAGSRTIGATTAAVNAGTGAVLTQGAATQGLVNSTSNRTDNGIRAGFGATAESLNNVQSKFDAQSKDIEAVRLGMNAMNQKLQSQISDVQRAQKNAKETLEVIKNSSVKNEQELASLKTKATDANTQLETAVKTLEAQQKALDDLKAKADQLPNSEQSAQMRAQLDAAAQANQKAFDDIKSQQAEMKTAIEGLKASAPTIVVVPQSTGTQAASSPAANTPEASPIDPKQLAPVPDTQAMVAP